MLKGETEIKQRKTGETENKEMRVHKGRDETKAERRDEGHILIRQELKTCKTGIKVKLMEEEKRTLTNTR